VARTATVAWREFLGHGTFFSIPCNHPGGSWHNRGVMAPRPDASHPALTEAERSAEAALVQACRQGDPRALEQLYRTHVDRVSRVIGRLLGPTPDLEDVVQATFVEIFRSFERFRGEASLSTWVVRIAVHVARHHLRQGVRRLVPLELVPDEASAAGHAADESMDERRIVARVHTILDSMSPLRRIAFLLYVLEGYSVEEVAALMGAGRAATKSRIFWARREFLRRARKDPILKELASAQGEEEQS